MNNSLARLIDGMCATLRNEVIPRLDDEFARGQVFGVIYLLNTFKVRADWAVRFLAQQVAAQRSAFAEVAGLLKGHALAVTLPPLPPSEPPQPITAGELESMRDEGNRAIVALMAWAEQRREHLAPELGAGIEQALRRCMRAEIDIEMKNSARPMFAEMSAGAESRDRA